MAEHEALLLVLQLARECSQSFRVIILQKLKHRRRRLLLQCRQQLLRQTEKELVIVEAADDCVTDVVRDALHSDPLTVDLHQAAELLILHLQEMSEDAPGLQALAQDARGVRSVHCVSALGSFGL